MLVCCRVGVFQNMRSKSCWVIVARISENWVKVWFKMNTTSRGFDRRLDKLHDFLSIADNEKRLTLR